MFLIDFQNVLINLSRDFSRLLPVKITQHLNKTDKFSKFQLVERRFILGFFVNLSKEGAKLFLFLFLF